VTVDSREKIFFNCILVNHLGEAFCVLLNNKDIADRMFQQCVEHSNMYDKEELKAKKDEIVQLYSVVDATFKDCIIE